MTRHRKAKLLHGGHKGAEAEFGFNAARWGIEEVTYSFEGHIMARAENVHVLDADALRRGDVSMEIVSQRMGRTYTRGDKMRRIFQSIFHMVNEAHAVFAIGRIQEDDTVRGGTGWGVELAKFFNRPVSVYCQERSGWFGWEGGSWTPGAP
ncbi:MAG: hypothetical protein AAF772_18690, partial [Acidobacteriota bacterium]